MKKAGSMAAVLADAARQLASAGVPSATLDARLIVSHVLGGGPAAAFVDRDRPISGPERHQLEELLRRRAAREPLARILGQREFWSLRFAVTAEVFDPRPDSETVIEAALERIENRGEARRVLDLGTGSGSLLLALLSELPIATGVGVDLSPVVCGVARDNAQRLGLEERVRFVVGDWADGLSGPFDVILSNPPYIPEGDLGALPPEVVHYDPHLALVGGPDGLRCYRKLAASIPALLAPSGFAVVELGAGQAKAVADILTQHGLVVESIRLDLAGHERSIVVALPEVGGETVRRERGKRCLKTVASDHAFC